MQDVIENIRRLFEDGFNTGDLALADTLLAPDYVDHSTLAAPGSGIEGFKKRIIMLRKTMPDVRFTVEDIFASGNRVAFCWTAQGTDTGGFMGRPPTGRTITVTGINIEYLENGRIVEHWSSPDNLGMLQQFGIVSF